ncbi:MAG: FAD-dependent oxidoreductase [Eubacteriales bacterium]
MAKYDVAVCGGGPAGIIAAVAAARNGAKTILIEKYGFLGGMATLSLVSPISVFNKKGKRIIAGIPLEFAEEMERLGGADTSFPSGNIHFDPEIYKLVAQRMVLGSGATLLLHSYITGCKREGGRVTSITLENKSGRQTLEAGYFIDCTGDADLVKYAGFPFRIGDERKELQPMTLWFRLGGVDTDRLENMEMRESGRRHVNTRIREKLLSLGGEVPKFGGPWMLTTLRRGEASVNMSRFAGDGTDVLSLTEAECRLREDVFRLVALLRENFEEFRNCYIIDTGTQVGIRETRRIDGLYEMTADDILSPKDFPDTIAKGGHPIDIHKPDSREQDLRRVDEGYNIPYRTLIPKGSENLLVAGRTISATREAIASIRVQATCMALGQAAGTATAICSKNNLPVGKINITELRETLISPGAII